MLHIIHKKFLILASTCYVCVPLSLLEIKLKDRHCHFLALSLKERGHFYTAQLLKSLEYEVVSHLFFHELHNLVALLLVVNRVNIS